MKTPEKQLKLYGESFNLITSFPNLTTDQISQLLLEIWLSNEVIIVTSKIQQPLDYAIFELIHDVYENTDITSLKTLKHRYNLFQQILLHELINRQFRINFKPIKIFDISAYELPLDFFVQEQDLETYNAFVAKYSIF